MKIHHHHRLVDIDGCISAFVLNTQIIFHFGNDNKHRRSNEILMFNTDKNAQTALLSIARHSHEHLTTLIFSEDGKDVLHLEVRGPEAQEA